MDLPCGVKTAEELRDIVFKKTGIYYETTKTPLSNKFMEGTQFNVDRRRVMMAVHITSIHEKVDGFLDKSLEDRQKEIEEFESMIYEEVFEKYHGLNSWDNEEFHRMYTTIATTHLSRISTE